MSATAATRLDDFSPLDQIRYARDIIRIEAEALTQLGNRLGNEFSQAVDLLFACRGSVIVSGIGKAGLIGQKITATLASTGTRSHFLHPSEAVHGDLGRVHGDDVVLLLSNSGETEEVLQLLPALQRIEVPLIAVTGSRTSTMGRESTVVLELGPLQEACSLGLAPSTSTTAMLAIGDALALVTSRRRGFDARDFALFHPGGSLGRKLSTVDDYMRSLDQCRVAEANRTVREVFVTLGQPGRRSGAILLIDHEGRLEGIFTDSDLARLFEARRDEALDQPVRQVMTSNPRTVPSGSLVSDAVDILSERKLSELPVIDAGGFPVGLIDITDLVSIMSEEAA